MNLRQICDKALVERSLHLVVTQELLEDMNMQGLPDDLLINPRNIPQCFKYGLLLFEDVEESTLEYYFCRCACTGDLSSGMVAVTRNMVSFSLRAFDMNFNLYTIQVHAI